MILRSYTIIHVVISLLGIASGFVVIYGLVNADPLDGWTQFFLWTTILTSVTGFFFPFKRLMPSHVFGMISLVVLPAAIYARYSAHLVGGWRLTYVTCAIFAQYLNVFVLIVQMFQKIPALKKLAPTQKEPPFAIAQLVVLVAFIALGVLAAVRFSVNN
jgi:hypothetical protein